MNPYISLGWSAVCVLVPLIGMAIMAGAAEPVSVPVAPGGSPAFTLPVLPYAQKALEPYLSSRTMEFHYARHHQAYVDNLNKLVAGTEWATGRPLERVVLESAGMADKAADFNTAAQAWNHEFFWKSMKPGGGGHPAGRLMELIVKSFGSADEFKKIFLTEALAQFGSGWVWLVQEGEAVKIVKTSNADTPMVHGQVALLACDVWEHAYYLDYQNRRKDYVQAYLDHLVNWEFAASQLK